jgi:DNA polymerase-3 subunit gamma/tau
MSYVVLARKWRPQSFEDLVGQEHVSTTIGNAIAQNRVAHAFLFTGVRGVGKTTSARLLAKCLNCVGADGKLPGPTATPCNQCAPCREITAGQDLDVQEIDGASYNGVDEVRRLQEGMGFRPARDRFKVYVVDEVHMLSSAAWNAFLKTLEEPPPHVKFIFATTEVQKVPVTILSRCQRYDFKLIPTQAIARRLDEVLALEKIEAAPSGVQVLAREAAGSMRDAMSLLDQVIAYSGDKLSGEDVARVLGVADRAVMHELASALVQGDAAACLGVIERVAEQGYDIAHTTRDLLRHLRNLVVAKVGAPAANAAGPSGPSLRDLLDLADEEVRDVVDLAGRSELDELSRLFQGLSKGFDDIVRSGQPRMALEMTLVRLARRPPLLPLDELLSRLGDLERRLAGGAHPGPHAPSPRGGGGGGRSAGAHVTATLASAPPGVLPPPGPAPSIAEPMTPRTRGSLALAPPVTPVEPSVAVLAPIQGPVQAPLQAPFAAPAATPPAPSEREPGEKAPRGRPGLAATEGDPWRAIVDRVRAVRPDLASVLEHALPLEVTRERVIFGYAPTDAFLAARAAETEALDLVSRSVRAHFGAPTQVEVRSATALSSVPSGVRTVAAVDAEHREEDLAKARQSIERHPLVREAIRLFDAQLRDVKLPGSSG